MLKRRGEIHQLRIAFDGLVPQSFLKGKKVLVFSDLRGLLALKRICSHEKTRKYFREKIDAHPSKSPGQRTYDEILYRCGSFNLVPLLRV